jgi:hypothetical protein
MTAPNTPPEKPKKKMSFGVTLLIGLLVLATLSSVGPPIANWIVETTRSVGDTLESDEAQEVSRSAGEWVASHFAGVIFGAILAFVVVVIYEKRAKASARPIWLYAFGLCCGLPFVIHLITPNICIGSGAAVLGCVVAIYLVTRHHQSQEQN